MPQLKNEMTIFVAVVEENGFSSAARRLNLNPSTISKTIARIEDSLNVRLINRNSRKFAITREGLTFYSGCRLAVDAMEDAEASVYGNNAKPQGLVRVFASATVAESRIGTLMGEFHRDYGDIKIEFHLRNGYVDPIEAGVDVTISHERPINDQFVMRRIGNTRLVVCASPRFIDQFGLPRTPRDLLRFECLMSTREMFNHWHFMEHGKCYSIKASGSFRASQGSMLRQLAIQGIGIASLASTMVAEDIERGALVPILTDYDCPEGIPLYAVYHDRKHINARIRIFVDYLVDRFARQDQPEDTGILQQA